MKRKWNFFSGGLVALFIVTALFVFVSSCGWVGVKQGSTGTELTPVQEGIAVTYEGVALGLNMVKGYIKGQEVSGKLQGQALDDVIAKWENARQLFLKAGDEIKESIAAKDPPTQEQKMALYNSLLQKAAFELGKLDYLKTGGKTSLKLPEGDPLEVTPYEKGPLTA